MVHNMHMSEQNTFSSELKRLGIKKAELARALGLKAGTVYRWTDETVPMYAMAYLGLRHEKEPVR